MAVDDVVIVKDDSLARVVQTYPSDDGLVRKVKVLVTDPSIDEDGRRSKASVFLERSVHKLVFFILKPERRPGVPNEEPEVEPEQ